MENKKEEKKKKRRLTIRDIADFETPVSSTRWAFATVIKTDIYLIVITVIAGLVGHFIKMPIPNEFYSSVVVLLGVITGIIGGNKALQGFETKKEERYISKEKDVEKTEENEE